MTTNVAAGTNCWTKAEDWLAATLADLSAFQLFSGAADAAEALTRIHQDEYTLPVFQDTYTDLELQGLGRGHAIIGSATNGGYAKTRSSRNANFFVPSGVLELALWRILLGHEDNEPDWMRGADRDMRNRGGDIIDQLIAAAVADLDQPPYIRSYQVTDGPSYLAPTKAEGMGTWQVLTIAIVWSNMD